MSLSYFIAVRVITEVAQEQSALRTTLSIFQLQVNKSAKRKLLLLVDILVAEDDSDAADLYKAALEARGHKVSTTYDGQQCLNTYQNAIHRRVASGKNLFSRQPFDAVILDYKLPKVDGLEVAKEILRLNPQQRIIFASAYTKSTLADAVKELKQVVELIQKPFEPEIIVEVIEDRSVAKKLDELNSDITTNISLGNANSKEINILLERLKKIQNEGTIY